MWTRKWLSSELALEARRLLEPESDMVILLVLCDMLLQARSNLFESVLIAGVGNRS